MAHAARDLATAVSEQTLRGMRQALAVALAGVLCLLAWGGSAWAQGVPPPATYTAVDENGVNIVTGELFTSTPAISIGQPGMGGLAYQRTYSSGDQVWRDNVTGLITAEEQTFTVNLLGASELFEFDGTNFAPTEGTGGRLTLSGGVYTYTTASGAVALFTQNPPGNAIHITSLTLPSGEVLTFTYTTLNGPLGPLISRLQSVTNNLGYQLSFRYENDDADGSGINLIEVTAINNAAEYCTPTANGCTLSGSWPRLTFGVDGTTQTVTDSLSRTTRYAFTTGRITGIRWPGSGSDDVTISYSGANVHQISNGVGTWTYSAWSNGATVVDPLGHSQVFVVNGGRVTSWQNGVQKTTIYLYDGSGRLTRITQPEGNYTSFAYDSRGNATEVRQVAKSGSGLAEIVTTASYPASCTSGGVTAATCNLPTSTTDARGFRTDYAYDATHGGVVEVTAPAPSGSAPVGSNTRPQTRYSYTQMNAYYKNSSGSIVAAPTPVYRLTEVSACATSSSCDGGADETVTTIGYGSTGMANNRLPLTVSSGAGNGSLTATSTMAYDDVGNLLTVDGPLAGSADLTRTRFDALRRRIGVVEPDPDGSGSLEHRALRFNHNTLGVTTSVERGTVDSQSDAHWSSGFTTLETLNLSYDSVGRRTQSNFVASGATHAVTQYSYDNANRLDCVAVRMNTAEFATPPASACTLDTEASVGPDRITRYTYDNANRVTQVANGYGTSVQQNTVTQTWSNNGRLATIADANGNLTTYEYDGFDRLRKIRFPNTSGGGSSTTNYEQYTYDANSNVTVDRRRDGAEIAFSYDNLNRVTLMNAPSGSDDVAYEYDLFGRVTEASVGAHALAFAYDQLHRNTSAAGPLGTVAYQYDLAGNRTRVTWPGGSFYAQYDYDTTGAVTAIRENGASSGVGVLASYAYDNYGRRTSISRGNGVVTTFDYDTAGLLAELEQNLAGTSHDQTLTFTNNPAGQAGARDNTNSAYAWAHPAQGVTSYAANGLNQLTSAAGVAQTYDGRGNLTTGGYAYDVYNRLVGASGASLAYDPAGRLYETVGGAPPVTTRFLYDGADVIAEYDDGTTGLLRRYVHGPGFDEPIVWYEGAGTTDRRWLTTDRLGSVTAVTDDEGAMLSINTYDEYGVPGSSNAGRFQYTGQMWLPEAGVYHYKARAYDPDLGRLLQSDPILFAGGMNLYAYVEGDPINNTDPSGLFTRCVGYNAGGYTTETPLPNGDVLISITAFWRTSCWDSGPRGMQPDGGGEGGGGGGGGGEEGLDEIIVEVSKDEVCRALEQQRQGFESQAVMAAMSGSLALGVGGAAMFAPGAQVGGFIFLMAGAVTVGYGVHAQNQANRIADRQAQIGCEVLVG